MSDLDHEMKLLRATIAAKMHGGPEEIPRERLRELLAEFFEIALRRYIPKAP